MHVVLKFVLLFSNTTVIRSGRQILVFYYFVYCHLSFYFTWDVYVCKLICGHFFFWNDKNEKTKKQTMAQMRNDEIIQMNFSATSQTFGSVCSFILLLSHVELQFYLTSFMTKTFTFPLCETHPSPLNFQM